MRKRNLSVWLAVCMVASSIVALPVTANAEMYGDLEYTVNGNEIIITGCDESAATVIIPDKINGIPVIAIDEDAFWYCENLESIAIPDSVVCIYTAAFDFCTNLENVTVATNNPNYSSLDGIYTTKGKQS